MRVLTTFPPNYKQINLAFGIRGKAVLFCYGDTIHNPSRIKIPPELMIHEGVHCHQQGEDPEGWWERYIEDEAFRLHQEIAAHRAEYQDLLSRGHNDMLRKVAGRLASPLYGRLVSLQEALALLSDTSVSVTPI